MKKTTYDEVYDIVIKVLVEEFKKPVESLKPETDLKEDLGIDSLDRIDFLCAIEEIYGDDVFDMDEESDDVEIIQKNRKKRQDFYLTKTTHTFTLCILDTLNEYEEKENK